MLNYSELIPYCRSPRQTEIIKAVMEAGTQTKAAKALGITRQRVDEAVNVVKKHALKRLDSPDHGLLYPVPEGFTGDFTLQRGPTGELERSWIKGRADKEALKEAHEEFVRGLAASIKPAKAIKGPKNVSVDLASAIIFGDAHLGMLAHATETLAEDYNLERASKDIRDAIDYCVDCAPPSEQGWFINVGDFLHAASSKGTTFKGTPVDLAARHNQVFRAAGQVIRYAVDKMLTKFQKVVVVNARGNHDGDAGFALNVYIEAVYENEPRVEVLPNDSKFNFIEFGKCLIGINHGDQINMPRLVGVMTRLQAEAWGRTTFRRWWTGHIHHKVKKETDFGCTVESFHTLAPSDEWHAASGYGAERRVTLLTLHKEFGEVNRMEPTLEMIRAFAA